LVTFEAATPGPINNLTIEAATLGAINNLTTAPSVTLSGIDAYGNPQTIANSTDTPAAQYGYNTTSHGSNFAQMEGGTLTFSFAEPIEGFGAYVTGSQMPFFGTITFSDGSSQSIDLYDYSWNVDISGGVSFVGFIGAETEISSITIAAPYDAIGVDDVRFVVPEPATLGITVAAITGLGLLRRRRK
jgi:hypothetical protein